MEKVNLDSTPLLVGYRLVKAKDATTKVDVVALYKVHLDSEGKVWGVIGQPLFIAKDRDQMLETINRYKEEVQEILLQADMMQASTEQGTLHKLTDFPEPGATNPLSNLDPLGKSDKIPDSTKS